MDILILLAFLAFLVGAIIAFVHHSWAVGFIGTGLAILALAQSSLIEGKL